MLELLSCVLCLHGTSALCILPALWFINCVKQSCIFYSSAVRPSKDRCTSRVLYSSAVVINLSVRVTSDTISLQLCTSNIVGTYA
jgi:hypothetical protein